MCLIGQEASSPVPQFPHPIPKQECLTPEGEKKKLLLLCEEELAESKLIAISRAKLQNSFQMIFFFCRKLSLMGGVNFRVLDTLSGALPLVTALRAPPAWSSSMLRMLNIVHFRLPLGKA